MDRDSGAFFLSGPPALSQAPISRPGVVRMVTGFGNADVRVVAGFGNDEIRVLSDFSAGAAGRDRAAPGSGRSGRGDYPTAPVSPRGAPCPPNAGDGVQNRAEFSVAVPERLFRIGPAASADWHLTA